MLIGVRHTLFGRYPFDLTGPPARDGGPYPLDWRSLAAGHSDPHYIPRMKGPGGEPYDNPVAVSLYALARYTEHVIGGLTTARRAFMAQAAHLLENQDANGGWRYPIPAARYGVSPGWYSGMAQGLAVSVFLRAGHLTGDGTYHDAGNRAADLMFRPTQRGGCALLDEGGRAFIEECPSDPPSLILNGAMFALIGALELGGTTEERTGAAVQRLRELLPAFDNGHWSVYDLRFAISASYAYHVLHISQLRVMSWLTADPAFDEVADRWQRWAQDPRRRVRAAVEKAAFAARRAA
jgi:heparosan-N-sulfate-glucuronate 5-epimerase